jgi:lipopolysaccharide export system permease protein
MFIYQRYLIKNLLAPVILISLIITTIIWLTQSLRFLDLIVKTGIDPGTFFQLCLLLIPPLMFIILPIALFISVMYIYNKLFVNSELTILRTSGVSSIALARPALLIATVVCLLSYYLSLSLIPLSNQKFKDMVFLIKENYISLLLQEKVFLYPSNDMTIYIGKKGEKNNFAEIFIHDKRSAKAPITLIAKYGSFEKKNNKTIINLREGNRQEVDSDGNLSIIHFKELSLDLSIETTHIEEREKGISEKYMHELLFPGKNYSDYKLSRMRSEAHFRLIWPLVGITLTLIALTFILPAEYARAGQLKKLSFASLSGVLLLAIIFTLNNLGSDYSLLIVVEYTLIIFVIGFCIHKLNNSG